MENDLKNELNRIFTLMEYSYSKSKNFINEGEYTQKKEEKQDFPYTFTRVGGGQIRIDHTDKNEKIDIDKDLLDQFIEKLTELKTI
jgi:hypothetical protein